MNKTIGEAVDYAERLRQALPGSLEPFEIFVIPPFTALAHTCKILEGSSILTGAQNMHWEEQGAYTGEISARMLKDCGVSLVELGHSERRAYFGETDETINRKVQAALKWGLRPLICVGETKQEKELDVTQEVVAIQVKKALFGVPIDQLDQIILAYEPVWAIGNEGTAASPEYVQTVHAGIRKTIRNQYGHRATSELHILYGGSVNKQNAVAFFKQPDIDGLFIGRSAWDVESFLGIFNQLADVSKKPIRIL